VRIDELGVRALFTEAARFQSWLDVEAALAELTIIPPKCRIRASTECELAMFSPIVNFRFGATAGYTGTRGIGEVRPRGKPCCHRLLGADSHLPATVIKPPPSSSA